MLSIVLQLLCVVFFFNSCVSFNFDSLKDQTAQGVVFQAPSAPYKEMVKEGMDVSWENPKNNNTLSFFSNCSFAHQFISLKQFQKELLDGLKSFRLINQKQTIHQDQKAYHLYLSQLELKNQTIGMEIFLFKKEDCFYVLSFLASTVSGRGSRQVQIFKNFIREFRAP